MSDSLVFVTGNKGKFLSMLSYFKIDGIEDKLEWCDMDLDELDINDIFLISKYKAKQAYEILGKPCVVSDSGFYINNYPGKPMYPGAFAKRSGLTNDIDKLLDIMKDIPDRACKFMDVITFYDGLEYYSFVDEDKGYLANEPCGMENLKAKSKLWYLFISEGYDKTLAQMSEQELIDRKNGYVSANKKLVDWYKNEYVTRKRLLK